MPVRLERQCRESGCTKRTNDRSGYCADHLRSNTARDKKREYYAEREKNDKVRALYHTAAWARLKRIRFNRNPMCQRLIDGVQCRWRATLLHHLISPRQRPDLFLEPANTVCLCANCHPDTPGTPDWVEGVDYAPSDIAPPIVA